MTESQLQEAINTLEHWDWRKDYLDDGGGYALQDILSLARSHLHAMQSGEVPPKKKCSCLVEDNMGAFDCYCGAEEFNEARSQMLPLIVARDRRLAEKDERIRELEKHIAEHHKGQRSINQALNEGDGVYRP